MKGTRSKVPHSGHFKWLSQCQDWFTKSGGHARSLKLETWNFAWDHISPIHMLCKKVGLIWEHFETMVQPTKQSYLFWFWYWIFPWIHRYRNSENGSLRGLAALEDAKTDAIEAGVEEVNVIDEESGTLEFVSPTPNTNFVTIKGYHVKTGYKCQEVRIH